MRRLLILLLVAAAPIPCSAETRIPAGYIIVPVADCDLVTHVCKQQKPMSWQQTDAELVCMPTEQFVGILRDYKSCEVEATTFKKSIDELQLAFDALKVRYDAMLQTVASLRARLDATLPNWAWGLITGGSAGIGAGVGLGIGYGVWRH